jgi:hypothetical protein
MTMFRSEKYRRLVASLPCIQCGREGYTQCAHSNLSIFGKGMSLKAHDWATFPLCCDCHRELDQGSKYTKEEKKNLQFKYISLTLGRMVEDGYLLI